MPITRAKASQLLNQKEMALYDESRINGLRQLDGKAISTRIARARAARDRARDLVRRQKLASRADTGSKRGVSGAANQRSKDKAELMADILARFETGLRDADGKSRRATAPATKTTAPGKKAARTAGTKAVGKVANSPRKAATRTGKNAATKKAATGVGKKATTKKAATGIGPEDAARKAAAGVGKKAATKKVATGIGAKTATGKAAAATPAKQAAGKPATGNAQSVATTTRSAGPGRSTSRGGANEAPGSHGKAAVKPAAAKGGRTPSEAASGQPGASRSRPRKRAITPEQALAQTQALLEAKHARDQAPRPWAEVAEGGVDAGTPGYQSDSAARSARQLHAAEVRLPAIQGSVSTRDRINQGKRDHRGGGD